MVLGPSAISSPHKSWMEGEIMGSIPCWCMGCVFPQIEIVFFFKELLMSIFNCLSARKYAE